MYMKYLIITLCGDVVSFCMDFWMKVLNLEIYIYIYIYIYICYVVYGLLSHFKFCRPISFFYLRYWSICGVYACWGLASRIIYFVLVERGFIQFLVV